jgi:S1-C subfamily serine protease
VIASGSDLHTFTVTAVRPGSQAEKDGFKKADVISGLDGKSATQFTLGELRDQLTRDGARYEVEVHRSHDQITIPIQIVLMSIDKG